MKSPDSIARRHSRHHSKSKRRRTTHISAAYVANHVIAGLGYPTITRSTADAAGSKSDLVRRWLDDLQELGSRAVDGNPRRPKDSRAGVTARQPPSVPEPWAPHGLPLPGGLGNVHRPSEQRRHKHRRDSLDDSSVIAPMKRPNVTLIADDSSQTRQPRPKAAAKSYLERGMARHPSGADFSESEASFASSSPNNNFEKRARYKTRTDRYNAVKKQDNSKKQKKGKQGSATGSKTVRKKRQPMIVAREVMDNFKSQSILSERITMAPWLRPGLFDNGRASKKHIPDLTFHEMSFLKQPRREHEKQPLSRKRESENKRDEREREEISAFCLHNSIPDRYDAQGRGQPDVTGLSSHDGKTGGASSHSHDHRRAPSQAKAGRHHLVRAVDETPLKRRDKSNASTYISWSTSRPSPGPRAQLESDMRGNNSTPVHVQDALAQTGIFDNTGIHCASAFGNEASRRRAHFQDDLFSARSQPAEIRSREPTARLIPDQPVRIVLYRDRGTMVDGKHTGSDETKTHIKHTSTNVSTSPPAVPSRFAAAEESKDRASAKAMTCEPSIRLNAKANSSAMELQNVNTVKNVISLSEKPVQPELGPGRPKAPKYTVFERLEALVEDARPRCYEPATSTVAEKDQPTRLVSDESFSLASRGNIPTARASSHAPSPGLTVNRVASAPVYTTSQNDRTSLDLFSCGYPTYPAFQVDENLRRYGVSQLQHESTTTYHDPSRNEVPTNARPSSMVPRQDHIHEVQQSMQAYISEIERDLDEPPAQVEFSIASPLMEALAMDILDRPRFAGDNGSHSGVSYDVRNTRLPAKHADASHSDRAAVTDWELNEEQRFMSTFWRPNEYYF